MEHCGAEIIEAGCTPDLISLGRTEKGVFVLSMVAQVGGYSVFCPTLDFIFFALSTPGEQPREPLDAAF